jgi:hypothetical protein
MPDNYEIIDSLKKKRNDLLQQFLPDNILERVIHFDAVISSLTAENTIIAAPLHVPGFKVEPLKPTQAIISYSSFTLKDAVLKFIKDNNKFLTSRQISDGLIGSFSDKEIDKFRIQISGVVSGLGRDGKIVKYQYGSGAKEASWGAKSWLNDKGQPLEGKEPVIEEKQSIEIDFD